MLPTLHTERLTLEPLSRRHALAFLAYHERNREHLKPWEPARDVRYAFDVLNLHRLETSYQPANERSGRVLRKLGFVVEGYARDYLLLNGSWRDGILVSLTNPDWR